MRKFFLITLIVLCMCGCAKISEKEFSNDSINKCEIVDETKYYKVVYSENLYSYYIYDKNHQIVKSEENLNRQPHLTLTGDNLVQFTLQAGTGKGTQWGYFYDADSNQFSQIYNCIYDQYNGKVVCGDLKKIIVRDIFDKEKFHREITSFQKEIANVAEPLIDVKFVDLGTCVEVSYYTGENYEIATEKFEL